LFKDLVEEMYRDDTEARIELETSEKISQPKLAFR
jgi:hypothetical protein